LVLEFQHGGGDVAGCDDILLLANGRFDDSGMEGIRDQRDDQVDFGNFGVECFVIGDIEGDGVGVLDAFTEGFGTFEGSTGYDRLAEALEFCRQVQEQSFTDGDLNASISEDLNCGFGDEAGAEEKGFLGRIAQL
jgi:hypothetical protein